MKDRIDKILVDLGYFDSRERAKTNIMAGRVSVDNFIVDKPGSIISSESKIQIKEDEIPFVSRGGLKLDKSIKLWNIDLKDKICMDIGASTGGFTDVMLKNGALRVYSIDVGYGQLDWKLRNHPAVVNMERTNIRYVEPENLADKIDFFSIDVSFISLKLVLPKLISLGQAEFECIALIKPQFEVGKNEVGRNGVVKEASLHQKAILNALSYAKDNGLWPKDISYSPIKGPKGNIEFLMYLTSKEIPDRGIEDKVESLVKEAHQSLLIH